MPDQHLYPSTPAYPAPLMGSSPYAAPPVGWTAPPRPQPKGSFPVIGVFLTVAAVVLLMVNLAAAAVALGHQPPAFQPGPASSAPPVLDPATATRCNVAVCTVVPSSTWSAYNISNDYICLAPTNVGDRHFNVCVQSYTVSQPLTGPQALDKAAQNDYTNDKGTNLTTCQPITADHLAGLYGFEKAICYTYPGTPSPWPIHLLEFDAVNAAGTVVYSVTVSAAESHFKEMLRDPTASRIVNGTRWRLQ